MKALGKDQKIEGTNIRFMGDPAAELTKKLDDAGVLKTVSAMARHHAMFCVCSGGQGRWYTTQY